MAEVDDPRNRVNQVVLISDVHASSFAHYGAKPTFRAQSDAHEHVPYVSGRSLRPGEWQDLQFDAREPILGDYDFRGWRYVRFSGSIDVAEVSLWRNRKP